MTGSALDSSAEVFSVPRARHPNSSLDPLPTSGLMSGYGLSSKRKIPPDHRHPVMGAHD